MEKTQNLFEIKVNIWKHNELHKRGSNIMLLSESQTPTYRQLRDLLCEQLFLNYDQITILDPDNQDIKELYDWFVQKDQVVQNIDKIKIIIEHEKPKPKIIGLTGCCRGGKTTAANYLKFSLNAEVMFLDSFYRDEKYIEEKLGNNWEVPEAYDWEQILVQLGKSIEKCQANGTPYLILDSFILLYNEKVGQLCDYIFFIDIPDEEIKKRRQGYAETYENYVENTVLVEYKKYKAFAHQKYENNMHFLSGVTPKLELFNQVRNIIMQKKN